jgi:hypothetical protein
MGKSPGFALTAVLTLALGIGASTAVFTVVDSVILKPLTYRESDRLVAAWQSGSFLGGKPVGPNPRHVDVWAQRSNAFTGLTILGYGTMSVALGSENARPIGAVTCQANLFQVLGTRPMRGRDFSSWRRQGWRPACRNSDLFRLAEFCIAVILV